MYETLEELKEAICEAYGDEADEIILFDNPDYSTAFLGISHDNRAIYSFDKMVEFLVERDKMTEDEAREFIDYNSARSLPYIGTKSPIILYEV